MRKTNDKTLKEVTSKCCRFIRLGKRYDGTGIIAHWPQFVGKSVANRTKELYITRQKAAPAY